MNEREKSDRFWNEFWYQVSLNTFRVAVVALFFFSLLEILTPGFVSYFFNLNIILSIAVGSGLLVVLARELPRTALEAKRSGEQPRRRWPNLAVTIVTAVIAGALIFVKTAPLGPTRYGAALVTVMVSGLLITLILGDGSPDDFPFPRTQGDGVFDGPPQDRSKERSHRK